MKITEDYIRKIVREEIEAYFQHQKDSVSVVLDQNSEYNSLKDVSEEMYRKALNTMDSNLDEQNKPKVGIFWYSPQIDELFGVIAIDAATAPKSGDGLRTCKELHKYVWKKQYNYSKFHNENTPFHGDYKYTPRGRIFYDDELDIYHVMVGAWMNDYPSVRQKIKEAFNLTDSKLHVVFERGIHWEIGMGYGE